MNKELVTGLLIDKLKAKLAEQRTEISKKIISEAEEKKKIQPHVEEMIKSVASSNAKPEHKKVAINAILKAHGHKVQESADLHEDHFSDKELESILDKFEKDMNLDGAKAVEDYISAEADGNKVKAAKAAAAIKKAMKK